MDTPEAAWAAAVQTRRRARATTRMPGGRTLKLTPLLITLAFLLPATTGALPVSDEAPWGAWYAERIVDDVAVATELAIGVKSDGDPVAAFLSGNPATGQSTLAFVERINGQWALTWPTYDSVAPDIVVGPDDTIHMTHRERVSPSSVPLNYGTRTNGIWTFETIHADGSVGPLAPIDLDPQGYPHVAYGTGQGPTIHHAYKDATGWHHETVATAGGSRYDLAVDTLGQVHIVYAIFPNIHHALRDTTGTWTTSPPLTECAGNPTIDTDTTNTPHIACGDDTHGLVYYTQQNGQWIHEVADNGCGGDVLICRPSYGAGYEPSLQVDDRDRPHIVYRYITVLGTFGAAFQTHPLYATKIDGEWHVETVDRDGWSHGYQPDIELDANGVPHVIYITGYEGVAAGTKGPNRAVYATPLAPQAAGVVG